MEVGYGFNCFGFVVVIVCGGFRLESEVLDFGLVRLGVRRNVKGSVYYRG